MGFYFLFYFTSFPLRCRQPYDCQISTYTPCPCPALPYPTLPVYLSAASCLDVRCFTIIGARSLHPSICICIRLQRIVRCPVIYIYVPKYLHPTPPPTPPWPHQSQLLYTVYTTLLCSALRLNLCLSCE